MSSVRATFFLLNTIRAICCLWSLGISYRKLRARRYYRRASVFLNTYFLLFECLWDSLILIDVTFLLYPFYALPLSHVISLFHLTWEPAVIYCLLFIVFWPKLHHCSYVTFRQQSSYYQIGTHSCVWNWKEFLFMRTGSSPRAQFRSLRRSSTRCGELPLFALINLVLTDAQLATFQLLIFFFLLLLNCVRWLVSNELLRLSQNLLYVTLVVRVEQLLFSLFLLTWRIILQYETEPPPADLKPVLQHPKAIFYDFLHL